MFFKFKQVLVSCAFAFIASQLVGCAAPMVVPSELKPLSSQRELQLEKEIAFKFKSGLAVEREIALIPGTYRGVGQDADGIWYLGKLNSLRETVTDRGGAFAYPKEWVGVPNFNYGGLYVPNDLSLPPRVFTIYGRGVLKAPVASPVTESETAVGVALNAQAANPAVFGGGGAVATGVNTGVAAGVVAGLLAIDRADWGNYQIHPDQPTQGVEWRKYIQVSIKQ